MKRSFIVPVVVALVIVLVGVRAGLLAAIEVAVIAVVVLGGSAYALLRVARTEAGRRQALAAQVSPQPVQHCNCCDKACLLAKVCAPGAEPTVVHGAEPSVVHDAEPTVLHEQVS